MKMTAQDFELANQISELNHLLAADTDTNLGQIGELLSLATKARIEMDVDVIDGQRPISHLTDAMRSVAEARKSLALAHSAMDKLIQEQADGNWICPDRASETQPAPVLKIAR